METIRCVKCSKRFKTSKTLKSHVQTVHNMISNPFDCLMCCKTFKYKKSIQNHMTVHTGEKSYHCKQCGEEFRLFRQLHAHLKNSHPKNNASTTTVADCIFCVKTFKSKSTGFNHFQVHTKERPYFCQICDKELLCGSSLRCHRANYHPEKYPDSKAKFICSICDKGFLYKRQLEEHLLVHLPDRPFKCQFCQKTFKRKSEMQKHSLIHGEPCNYNCIQCGKSFSQGYRLKIHIETVHNSLKKRVECQICSKTFPQKEHLSTHMRIHTNEKPFRCKICQRGFITSCQLRLHGGFHTKVAEEDKFQCPDCNKKLKSRADLVRHRQIHKPGSFKCEVCWKFFTVKRRLAEHIKCHTLEKTHECRICGKGFLTSTNRNIHETFHFPKKHDCSVCGMKFHLVGSLKVHSRQHSQEAYTTCLFCNRSFYIWIALQVHLQRHANENPYICKYCGKELASNHNLKRHIFKLH